MLGEKTNNISNFFVAMYLVKYPLMSHPLMILFVKLYFLYKRRCLWHTSIAVLTVMLERSRWDDFSIDLTRQRECVSCYYYVLYFDEFLFLCSPGLATGPRTSDRNSPFPMANGTGPDLTPISRAFHGLRQSGGGQKVPGCVRFNQRKKKQQQLYSNHSIKNESIDQLINYFIIFRSFDFREKTQNN